MVVCSNVLIVISSYAIRSYVLLGNKYNVFYWWHASVFHSLHAIVRRFSIRSVLRDVDMYSVDTSMLSSRIMFYVLRYIVDLYAPMFYS